MAAVESSAGKVPLKVAVILNPSDDAEGGRCLEVAPNNSISMKRPGSAAAGKTFGPFTALHETAASLFDAAPVSIDREIEESLRSGVSFGVLSFGNMGQGKTTAFWGSPALGEYTSWSGLRRQISRPARNDWSNDRRVRAGACGGRPCAASGGRG